MKGGYAPLSHSAAVLVFKVLPWETFDLIVRHAPLVS